MPKQSERQRFLQDIVEVIAIDILEEEDDDLLGGEQDRFGNYGTGASLNRSQRLWGIGKGTVDDYTDRMVLALVDLATKAHLLKFFRFRHAALQLAHG
ncbi:hypothetical protein JG688_00012216 [Phytophthora aleatoria]|uniref:Uncharacterized protein n=1 Tax=Phytophthora aleatoria TaxID=2496075 RepID=A0A8J5J300_9STRA|nr:hypothetical protein JG688_00012216 [Phytophthora aleatoria]